MAAGCTQTLHRRRRRETTDSDESEFRPAKAARNGVAYLVDAIPDGFYLVADAADPRDAFEGVRAVTHIAPPDASGGIIGEPVTQEGVIAIPACTLGLCMSVTDAAYRTTTEVRWSRRCMAVS